MQAAGIRFTIVGLLLSVSLVLSTAANAQLVDSPQNLLKSWTEAYGSKKGEAMSRVYARDAQFISAITKEPAIGIESIRQHFERTGHEVAERSATLTKVQFHSRKRLTIVTGTMELKQRLKDGTSRTRKTRFSMAIVRESRRQWSILNHHASSMPN